MNGLSTIRGFTVTQPWATSIALGHKRIETRSWHTRYRGLIAIHAAKDPYLLRPIHGDLCAVVAAWDLTELERSVMAGRAQP